MPSPTQKIRVLPVDDSLFFLKILERHLSADPQIEVVGLALSAEDALDKIKSLKPDVLTLDIEMPETDGVEFLKTITPKAPIPVIVVSSRPNQLLEALDAGAVDFVRKPLSSQNTNTFFSDLITKVKIASIAHVHRSAKADIPADALSSNPEFAQSMVIAIGASTGGTEAILEVVSSLPEATPCVLIVQHMPPLFTKMYAERLSKNCKMHVCEARHGERVEPGKIIIGAGDCHLSLAADYRGYYVKSRPGPKVSGHCPSVDVLFSSVAELAGKNAVGVLLTGMGADGAEGLLQMRKAGAYTIGQDRNSCVVYGMPQAAYSAGAVQKQLPLAAISGEIIAHLNRLQQKN